MNLLGGVFTGPGSQMVHNTVLGVPEPVFRQQWIQMLWRAMSASKRGMRTPSMRWSGRGKHRRTDKLEENRPPKWLRRLRANTVEK